MASLTIVVKPTHACPARCVYCCDGQSAKTAPQSMSRHTLEILMTELQRYGRDRNINSVRFIWHGGEPLAVPEGFYEHVLTLQERHLIAAGITVRNDMQSNLLVIDDAKIDVLRRLLGQGSTIGTSVDPVPGMRILPGGDYLSCWREGLRQVEAAGFRCGLVVVVHQETLDEPERLWQMLAEYGGTRPVRFNPILPTGRAAHRQRCSLHISSLQWGEFLVELYRKWQQFDERPLWNPIAELDDYHCGGQPGRLACDHSGGCTNSILGVDLDGTVYSCGRGIDEATSRFGNLHVDGLDQILQMRPRVVQGDRWVDLGLGHCRTCEWWSYCRGGCPLDAEHHEPASMWCEGRRHFFNQVFGTPRGAPRSA